MVGWTSFQNINKNAKSTMQVNEKIFEVDQIVCHRTHKGTEEYLVTWKGFEVSSATWEPVEHLIGCRDLIEQFQRQTNPIPGANPHQLVRTKRARTIHVEMLMTRKNKLKRTKSMADADSFSDSDSQKNLDKSLPLPYRKKGLTESEKLIRDTLLHESKTMRPEKTSLNKINGIFECYVVNNTSKRTELVVCTIHKSYMNITLNNTKRHNVLTVDMLNSISDSLVKARKNSDIKAVLLCNNGDFFCSGIDYTEFTDCAEDKKYKHLVNDLVASVKDLMDALYNLNKPIVAAVNGPALEFGMSLVLAADFVFATSKSTFDLLYSKLGLTPVGMITQTLPKIVGRNIANSLIHFGGTFTASIARDRGLVLDLYSPGCFHEEMDMKMKQLAQSSSTALESTKKLIRYFDFIHYKDICTEEIKVYQQQLLSKDTRIKMKENWTLAINLFSDI